MKKHSFLAAVALVCAVVVSGCKKESAGPSGNVIKIGEFASLTGKEAAFGQSSHKGTLLAIEEINSAGGVLGKKLELIYEDNRSTPGESATVVQKLIARDKVVAILGEVATGRSLEAAPICQKNRIPQVSPSSTNPRVTEMGDYIFRVCFTDPFQGKLLANFAKKTLKVQQVALLTDVAAPYSVGLAKYFREPFVANGGTVVMEKSFSSGDKDFKPQLTAIKAANPQAIFAPCYYTEAGLIAVQARQLARPSKALIIPPTIRRNWTLPWCKALSKSSKPDSMAKPLMPWPPLATIRPWSWPTPSSAPAAPKGRKFVTPWRRPRTSLA